jgi:hypothetical protein
LISFFFLLLLIFLFSRRLIIPDPTLPFILATRSTTPDFLQINMAGESMDIEVAEKQLKSLEHSEQHYFNRQVLDISYRGFCCASMLTFCAPAITTMVRGNPLLISRSLG